MPPVKFMRSPGRRPRPRKGWVCAPPDFVGVGAQRCGTTRWHHLIVSHPGVTPAPHKEVHFFDRFVGTSDPDLSAYPAFFPRPEGSLCGEWTPRYMLDAWTPPLLAQAAPDAKVIVSLRDPVERYVSGMALSRLLAQTGGQVIGPDSPIAGVARGLYAPQLRAMARHFPADQILVLQFERCVADTAGELRRTFEFLGLDPEAAPEPDARRVNASDDVPHLPDRERAELVARFEDDVRALAEFGIDPGLWPNFRHLA